MHTKQIIALFEKITIWKNKGQRAPHKPLLILLAISEMVNKQQRYLLYADIRERLIELLNEFGPSRTVQYPHEPFSRLPKDGIWELKQDGNVIPIQKGGMYNKALLEYQISGGFTSLIWDAFHANSDLIQETVQLLLRSHFTENYHEDILRSLSLETFFEDKTLLVAKSRLYTPRDPKFRNRILEIYNYSCCICGYNLRISNTPIGLEAAHIKWHQAGGADSEQNGLALCAIHHKLLDYGALTLDENLKIKASEKLNGHREILQNQVIVHIGKPIQLPIFEKAYPEYSNIEWHVSEVFKQ